MATTNVKINLNIYLLSLISGILAALGSHIGRFAMSTSVPLIVMTLKNLPSNHQFDQSVDWFDLLDLKSLVISHKFHILIARGLVLLLMVLVNTMMWAMFAKALKSSNSCIEVTLINSASNIIFSSLIGLVFFNEILTNLWFVGLVLTFAGYTLVVVEKARLTQIKEDEKKQ